MNAKSRKNYMEFVEIIHEENIVFQVAEGRKSSEFRNGIGKSLLIDGIIHKGYEDRAETSPQKTAW